jgi:hypothetical protein
LFTSNPDNSGAVSPGGQVPLPPQYQPPAAAPTPPPPAAGPSWNPSGSDAGYTWITNPTGAPTDYSGFIGGTIGTGYGGNPTGPVYGAPDNPLLPPPPSTGPGSAGQGGGQSGTPPYMTDPGYLAALGLEQSGLSQLDAALKAARERAIIDFGDPALAAMAGFGLDPQAAAFAQQNYLSGNASLARLDKQHDLMKQAVINRLASHGILTSGDLGYQEGQADQDYGNNVYDTKQKLLDYLNGVQTQDTQARQGLHQGVISALQGAYQNFLDHPELTPGAPASANGGPPPPAPPPSAQASTPRPAAHKPVQKVLANAYTSGRKRFG